MAELAILVPSRGRPERFRELLDAIAEHSSAETIVYLGTDYDDPDLAGYVHAVTDHVVPVLHITDERKSLAGWTNSLARTALAGDSQVAYLASLGDDHRPRTNGWDMQLIHAIERTLSGPGFAYGNDLLQGQRMPTAWVASALAVKALGWMMQPGLEHMYVDNVIKDLGAEAGRLAYVSSVIVEHAHPIAGKVEWDESYRESNRAEQYEHDRKAFEEWRAGQMAHDAATLSALRY